MKKLILSTLTITILLSIVGCTKESNNVSADIALMTRPQGWKPIALFKDTTDNGIADSTSYFLSCHSDNYGVYNINGTYMGYTGNTLCSVNETNSGGTWWWDNQTTIPNSVFYYKPEPSVNPFNITHTCNIKQLTVDTFKVNIIIPSVTIGSTRTIYNKISATYIPN